MDLSEPATVVLSPGLAAILGVLSGADASFTVRELGRLAGVSPARAADVVNRLAAHGLVLIERHGAAHLCRLNTDHLAARAVSELCHLRPRLLGLVRNLIAAWEPPPVHASLFGSAARGDGSTSSDVDILLVRPDGVEPDDGAWAEQRSLAGREVHRASGNRVAWLEVSRDRLADVVRSNEPILAEWRRDGLHLAGEDLRVLLRRVA